MVFANCLPLLPCLIKKIMQWNCWIWGWPQTCQTNPKPHQNWNQKYRQTFGFWTGLVLTSIYSSWRIQIFGCWGHFASEKNKRPFQRWTKSLQILPKAPKSWLQELHFIEQPAIMLKSGLTLLAKGISNICMLKTHQCTFWVVINGLVKKNLENI